MLQKNKKKKGEQNSVRRGEGLIIIIIRRTDTLRPYSNHNQKEKKKSTHLLVHEKDRINKIILNFFLLGEVRE